MITGKRLTTKQIAEITVSNPFWTIENPPIILKSYKDGRKKMFAIINNVQYIIRQNKYGNEDWYEVLNDK